MWSLSEALLTRDSLCSSSPSSRKKRQEKDESRSGDDMLPHLNLCTDEAAMASPPSHSIQTNLIRGSSLLCKVRVPHRLFAACHATLLGLSLWGAFLAQVYDSDLFWSSSIVAGACLIRILWMISSAFSQAAVASTILAHGFGIGSSLDTQTMPVSDKQCRRQRRISYVRWLWCGRFGLLVTLLQFVAAAYMTFSFVNMTSKTKKRCHLDDKCPGKWNHEVFLSLTLGSWILTLTQCCMGSDILAWRSLYARRHEAWRAYYHEMFDYGIREALCCLGRVRYIKRDDDEVDSVAAVLGDLVSYRAAGASHLEFLAGLALLQLQPSSQPTAEQFPTAPVLLIEEATILHPFAVAAYTGLLLDIGRNPLLFPCAWIRRQGVLTPWKRNRLPNLEGDNWWKGHAAAFLRYSKLPPEALRKGRVCQEKRECAYFVAVVHHLRCVIVAVRGTESPEDLLTDGLGKESMLNQIDLGFLTSESFPGNLHFQSTKSHFAHEGIIDAARELALQLDNFSEFDTTSSSVSIEDMHTQNELGILTSLLGPGGECEGYALRFVGHSLGGSIATLTALRLHARYPQLHVYGYGVLPCLDAWTADACTSFATSIVYNDEFSSRLSVSSIKRLRIAAVKALAMKTSDVGMMTKLARQLLDTSQENGSSTISGSENVEFTKEVVVSKRSNKCRTRRFKFKLKGGIYLCSHACRCVIYMSNYSSTKSPNLQNNGVRQYTLCAHGATNQLSIGGPVEVLPCVEGCIFAGYDGNVSGMHEEVADIEQIYLDAGRENSDLPPDELEELIVTSGGDERNHAFIPIGPEENGESRDMNSCNGSDSREDVGSMIFQENQEEHELFLPGLIIHITPVKNTNTWRSRWGWDKKVQQMCEHQALVKDRRSFREILVSPSMFLDHMPWRCQQALDRVLEQLQSERHDTGGTQKINDCVDTMV